ncbi:MAG TPA: ABC transporter ATP-binding protein [Clostridia bacterium]|nr:ABC transporter ATP-binding protein [Clostridia bacterium]
MSLNITNVSKTYKGGLWKNGTQALCDVDFTLNNGKTLALIGQNGAGKTTLIKCVLNLLYPDKGKITFDESEIELLIKNGELGYMPESMRFPDMITLKEYVSDLMDLRGKKFGDYQERFNELVDKFYMTPHINKVFSKYSKGTMKKAAFIQAILHNPKLLVLDEPTDGLDPVSRRILLNEVTKIKQSGGTVIITTHILSDLQIVADEVIVLQKGVLIKHSQMNEIKGSLDDWYIETLLKNGGLENL